MIFLEEQAKKRFLINLAFTVTVGFIVYFSGKFLFSYLLPFVIATVIAWLVQKPAGFLSQKTKFKKGTCAAFLSVVFYVAVISVFIVICYYLTSLLKELLNDFPKFFEIFRNTVINLQKAFYSLLSGISDELAQKSENITQDMLGDIGHKFGSILSDLIASFAKGLPSFLFSSIVTLVAGCYISKDFEQLSKFLSGFLGRKIYGNIMKVKDILAGSVLKIVKGYLILMLITFGELTLAFFILGIKRPLLIALAVSFIDLLPVFGIGTVIIPWSISKFLLADAKMGVALLVIYVAVILIGNFLEPKIISGQIGINPLFTLISMFAGLKIFGFFGLFLLPIALIVAIKYYKNELDNERKTRT